MLIQKNDYNFEADIKTTKLQVSFEKFVKEYNKKITIYSIESLRPKRPVTTLSFD